MSEAADIKGPALAGAGKKPFFFPLWAGALVGGLFLALFIHQAATNATANVARIVVIDTNRLMQAKAMSTAGKDAQAIAAEAAAFSNQLTGVVKNLTGEGYVVMNSAHMIGWPAGADRTADVAKLMGVDLKLADAAVEQYAARGREILHLAKPAR